MDQEAFRKLLSTSKPGTSQSSSAPGRGSLLPPKAKDDQKKPTESSKAAFKPRKIKKQCGLNYRDRAAERRTGAAGDFAEVESVLENFEKQHADYEDREAVEEQRRYLGGDAEHTVLVKGLDFALLEQTKSRMAASTSAQDDEELEEAFRGAISASPPPLDQNTTTTSNTKKRTREDIVRELKKNKRTKGEGDANGAVSSTPLADRALDEAKREGKFKPIGFKPIGTLKDKEGKEVKKKKKRKVTENATGDSQQRPSESAVGPSSKKDEAGALDARQEPDKISSPTPEPGPEPGPEPVNEDFDIFADAGEYEGVNFDDDDDKGIDDSSKREVQPSEARETNDSTPADGEPRSRRKWFDDDEPPSPAERPLPSLNNQKGKSKEPSGSPEHTSPRDQRSGNEDADRDKEAERTSRLAPLTSSAVPSIRDILAADTAREAEEKRKARKEKRKRGGGGDGGGGNGEGKKVSAEAKLNRDYQKLKSYTEKKDKSS